MRTLASDLGGLLFIVLVVVIPLRGLRNAERLRDAIQRDDEARLRFYDRANLFKLVLAAVAGLLYVADGRRGYGLELLPNASAWPYFATSLVAFLVTTLVLVRRLAVPAGREKLQRAMACKTMLPTTVEERRAWIGVSVVAGTTEEFLYRGFALLYLHRLLPHADTAVLILLTATLFGFAHASQGWKGMVATGIVGAALGVVAVEAGLLTAMLIHTLLDLRVLLLLNMVHNRTHALGDEHASSPAPS